MGFLYLHDLHLDTGHVLLARVVDRAVERDHLTRYIARFRNAEVNRQLPGLVEEPTNLLGVTHSDRVLTNHIHGMQSIGKCSGKFTGACWSMFRSWTWLTLK